MTNPPPTHYGDLMVQVRERSTSDLGISSPYEICIRGKLDGRWFEWFSGIRLTTQQSGDRLPLTILHCPAMDQAKLRGIVNKLWDLNLTLVSVHQVQEPSLQEET
jgi:hypothetical protein